ncbi:TIGR02466 family protein [Candidatus Pelagibacter sp.]|nr:TIGR02466 family protein [Candidatus Pelagibacter sp.]|tara:strand:+ start:2055 stop:2654 length:600 start_codon:yes stop_codon:yes gene_type:complete
MSNIRIHKFFPVPVFEQRLENYKDLNPQLENFIYDLKKNNPEGQKRSNAGGWHSPFFNINESEPVKKLISSFTKSLPEIMTEHMGWRINKDKITILDMWSVVNKKNTFNVQHSHPNSLLSAAYYVKAKKNSGNIKFFDPKEMKTMYHPPIQKFNEISAEIIKIEPEEGKLLLFPSYLNHAVEENLSDEDRIVISFNLVC